MWLSAASHPTYCDIVSLLKRSLRPSRVLFGVLQSWCGFITGYAAADNDAP
jgi:hypothetical protein